MACCEAPKLTLVVAASVLLSEPLAAAACRRRIHAAARRGRPALHAHGAAGPVRRQGGRAAAANRPPDQDRPRSAERLRQGRPRRNRHRPGAAGDVRDHDPVQAARAVASRHDARRSWSRNSTASCGCPGLSNIWVPPIRNRIDMLATGIKSPVGVKVAGPDLATIDRLTGEIERALKDVPACHERARRAADRRALCRREHRPRRRGALRPEHRRRAVGRVARRSAARTSARPSRGCSASRSTCATRARCAIRCRSCASCRS